MAISALTDAILQPEGMSKIGLLQGPPGTGKSHTIVGLVQNAVVTVSVDVVP